MIPPSPPTPQHGSMVSAGLTSPEAARTRLLAQRPTETDENLSQWLKSLGVVPQQEVRLTYPVTGGYRREVTGYRFAGLTDENREQVRSGVQSAMTPATADQCEGWVSMMHCTMAHKSNTEAALEMVLTLYAARLAEYPADVAKEVCMAFSLRRAKPNWFPTLSELDEACEKEAQARQALLRSL